MQQALLVYVFARRGLHALPRSALGQPAPPSERADLERPDAAAARWPKAAAQDHTLQAFQAALVFAGRVEESAERRAGSIAGSAEAT